MTMMNLADHVISIAQREDRQVTNLQLQKIMYFVILNGMKEGFIDDDWLKMNYDQEFVVWKYGPVVENIYEKYSVFGASSIFFIKKERNEFEKLNFLIVNLLNEAPLHLIEKSRQRFLSKEREKSVRLSAKDLLEISKEQES